MLHHIDIKYFKIAVQNAKTGKCTDNDISVECPICGDSKRKNQKRLHLYIKNDITNINCFNGDCLCKNKTVYSFLQEFYPSLLDGYKREMFGNTFQNLKNEYKDVFKDIKLQKSEIKKDVTTYDLTQYFTYIEESEKALNYLKSRLIDYDKKYGNWYYGHQDLIINEKLYKIKNSIIIPLYYNNEMYGFYSRNLDQKIFYTYNPECNIGYKIWNWFYIDKSKPVYIFEGIFDAISSGLENIIALISAQLPEERLKELKEPIFVLDNDKTGLINSLKYVEKGYQVYIQPNKYNQKDMNKLNEFITKTQISELIKNNIFSGINATIKIRNKL